MPRILSQSWTIRLFINEVLPTSFASGKLFPSELYLGTHLSYPSICISFTAERDWIVADLTQRAASLEDLRGIWGLLQQVASDIPADLRSEAEQENILTEIMACCTSGFSPIAVDKDKAIVGALLVRRDDFEWGFKNSRAVHISYAAIAPGHRDQGVCAALVTEIQERRAPVFASVKSGNQSRVRRRTHETWLCT